MLAKLPRAIEEIKDMIKTFSKKYQQESERERERETVNRGDWGFLAAARAELRTNHPL